MDIFACITAYNVIQKGLIDKFKNVYGYLMGNIFHILCANGSAGGFFGTLTASEWGLAATGMGILSYWLIRNKVFASLDSSQARVNKMRLHTPFLQLFIWLILGMLSGSLVRLRFGDPLSVQGQLAMSIGMLAIELGMICSILVIAYTNFHGRYEGFGLNLKTLGKDIGWGAVNYIAVLPLIYICVWLVVFVCKLIFGADYELEKHNNLELLTQINIVFKIVLVFSSVIVAPVFEEFLFRGLIQTSLRTHLGSPWLGIVLTSLVFVVMHGNWSHWLPLMLLSVCMGYAYEKSGSILRSICIHVIFNSVSIAAALLSSN